MKNRPLYHRFRFALDGLRVVFATERSFRTECGFAVAAVLVLLVLRPGWQWAALITLCGMMVMALEMLNTALEYLIDHIHPEIAPAMKHAKDAGAAAVLIASIGSVIIAGLMLLSVLFG